MLTVLACVRTPDAARAVAVCADRLGVGASVRTAVTAVEAIARLAERPADLVFVDGPMTRPDPVGFVRRAMAYAPGATLVVYGLPEPAVASALISAGARGVIRGGDTDLVTAVTKTVLLLGLTEMPERVMATAGAHAGRGESGRHSRPEPVAAGVSGRRERVPVPVGSATERASGPLDIRNGGPGFASPRAMLASTVGAALGGVGPAAMRPAAARPGLTVVPQQRVDLAPAVRPPALTERELQVLRGMADGKSNAEIGRELFVSEDTVKTHARRLFRKLGARDRAHAVASGFRTGLVG
ncbi:MAG TPA: LuxR C-terminal-related transcriptional regulator [Micromonosporaceae bacterium]|nr:LuxR C-terminal-related transcriptional regulator [Micromonosporaceae bacterium]